MVSAWREIRDVASPQTPFALPNYPSQAPISFWFPSYSHSPLTHLTISSIPSCGRLVCCGRSSSIVVLSSRACLLLDALCLSEALVSFRRQKALERRFSRAAWFGPCVCARFSERYPICVSRYGYCSRPLWSRAAHSALCPSLFLLFVLTAPRPRRRRICRARPGST